MVHAGAAELLQRLEARYAGDQGARVVWDRRSGTERRTAVARVEVERRDGQRRFPAHRDVLVARGFFVARLVRPARRAGMSG